MPEFQTIDLSAEAGSWSICVVQPISAEGFATRMKNVFTLAKAQLQWERDNAPEH